MVLSDLCCMGFGVELLEARAGFTGGLGGRIQVEGSGLLGLRLRVSGFGVKVLG